MVTTMHWMKPTPMWNKSGVTLLVGEHFIIFPKFLFMHLSLYLHTSLLDYHILDILGHGSKCLDIMALHVLGLDIVGIIRPDCYQPSR